MAAPAATVTVPNGYLSGSEFIKRGEAERRAYVMGFTDGMLSAPMMALNDLPRVKLISNCMKQGGDVSDVQLMMMVDKFLANHPERLDEQMNALIFSALDVRCHIFEATK